MKASMPEIFGNGKLRLRLCSDILSCKLSHAYIIEGPNGSGKHLTALNIAKAVACERRSQDGIPLPCNSCETCRKISSGLSPDVITVGREADKAGIGVDAVRFIKNSVSTLPNDLDTKIYIIEDADKMTVQAQNALLLTLEEPPEFILFLLLCENADNLLETVRSRAPILRMSPIPNGEMREYLLEQAPEQIVAEARRLERTSPSELDEIITASGSCIGRAYSLLDPDKRAPTLEIRSQIRRIVNAFLENGSKTELLDVLSSLPQKRDELTARLELVCLALRDLLLLKKSDNASLCFYSDREEAAELSSKISVQSIIHKINITENAIESLQHNANIKLTVTALGLD